VAVRSRWSDGAVSLIATIAIIAGVALAGALVMALVHDRAPAGGFFRDSQRASAVLGVLGGGFAIILGFVVLLAYQNYSDAKVQAADEATAVKDMFETSALFGPAERDALRGDLICYARAVIADEWSSQADGESSPLVEQWIVRTEQQVDALAVSGEKQQVGFDQLFASRNDRDRARRERLEEATTVVPRILWVMLFIAGGSTVLYLLSFADGRQRRWVQCASMAIVCALVTAALLGVRFLDTPFGDHEGSIEPTQMTYSLDLMFAESAAQPPCDAEGRPHT
jgi:hypothetical protein